MWICQNCETLNDGEACVICGEAKAKSEELLNKAWKAEQCTTDMSNIDVSDENGEETSIIIGIKIIAVFLLVCLCTVLCVYK